MALIRRDIFFIFAQGHFLYINVVANWQKGHMKTIAIIGVLIILTMDTYAQEDQKRTEWLDKNYEEDYKSINDKDRVAIRFSWWRAFEKFTIIRIENIPTRIFNSDSSDTKVFQKYYAVSKTYHDDLNDYENRKYYLFDQHVTEINTEDFEKFIELIDRLKIMTKKSKKILMTDGSNWDIEISKDGKYFQLNTNNPDEATKTFGAEMIRLSGLKIDKDKIY